jgi:large conductance mechanosensitive channel
MFKEFKAFIMRGNVMDLAVGVIIGGAFGAITASLVADVIMPTLGLVLGKIDFSTMGYEVTKAVTDATGKVTKPAVIIAYGKFIQSIINFVIIAFAIFMMVKAVNKVMRKKEEVPAPVPPTKDQELLSEIRDLLKK